MSLISILYGISEVPTYSSFAKIQFRTFNVGKNISNTNLTEFDNSGRDEIIDRSISVISSDIFHEELATKLKENEIGLNLSWGIGRRERLNKVLSILGLEIKGADPVKISSLSTTDLAFLLGKMISTSVDFKERTATIKVTGLVPVTAQRVNFLVTNAIISTNQKIRREEMQKSVNFLQTQLDQARKRLSEANENLRMFYGENPNLVDSGGRNAQIDEHRDVQRQKEKIMDSMASNKKLLEFYKDKFVSFTNNSDTSAEVIDKFKQELVELKYKKKKFLFDGYDEANEGIIEINTKIKNIERILSENSFQDVKSIGNRLVGVGHDKTVSEKIMELQDQIKKDQFELELVKEREEKTSPKTTNASKSMLLLENLKVEVRLATSIFEDLSKRLEYAQIQMNDSESNQVEMRESPSMPVNSNVLPITPRAFFGFFVGYLLSVSYFILSMLFNAKITNWQSVEEMGLSYAGILRDFDPNLTEILTNLDCLDKDFQDETPIILCACPEGSISFQSIFLLTGFLARQREKSLYIIVGQAEIPIRYKLISDLGIAQVYSHSNDREFLLSIADKKTIKSLKETVQILESNYRMKFSAVFLFYINGLYDPNYHIGVKIATSVLLLGPPAKYSAPEYLKLIQGFKETGVSNFAFAEVGDHFQRQGRAKQMMQEEFNYTGSSRQRDSGGWRKVFFD